MNELIDRLLNLVAPHICKGCGRLGAALCGRCIFNILQTQFRRCLMCYRELDVKDFTEYGDLCSTCARTSLFIRAYAVGPRAKTLQRLVDDYKFNSERGAAQPIAKLLAQTLPDNLPPDLTVVPLTTVAKNVRERGFDHMKLACRKLARARRLPFAPNVLARMNNLTQHFLKNPAARRDNAAKSLAINPRVKVPAKVLLVDDIFTTGATVDAAAKILHAAGAREIWLTVVVRQPDRRRTK